MSAPAIAPAGERAASLALHAVAASRRGDAVLDDVSLAVAAGEHAVVLGASGAGKSTLLRVALGLERIDAGRVELLGRDLATLGRSERNALRQRVGVLLARDALFDERSVEENVALGVRAGSREVTRRAVREALLLVGLKHVEHRRPEALAPGERRRVALARAIAGRPALLVADEPAAALDPVAAGAVHTLLAQLRVRLELALLVATRDPRALEGADRAHFLHGGRIAAADRPDLLRKRPDAALQQLLAGRPYGPIAP
jgi:ABC-type transporter Mla maintaining outer membrane lipid asymmetry ATPase subunit MlaF